MRQVSQAQWSDTPSAATAEVQPAHITLRDDGRYEWFSAVGPAAAMLQLNATTGRYETVPGATTGLVVRTIGVGRVIVR